MSWGGIAAILLGLLLLKAIFDPDTKIYRCPNCNLTLQKNTRFCRRCNQEISW